MHDGPSVVAKNRSSMQPSWVGGDEESMDVDGDDDGAREELMPPPATGPPITGDTAIPPIVDCWMC